MLLLCCMKWCCSCSSRDGCGILSASTLSAGSCYWWRCGVPSSYLSGSSIGEGIRVGVIVGSIEICNFIFCGFILNKGGGKAGGCKKDAKRLGWTSVPGTSSSSDSSLTSSSPDDEDNDEWLKSSSDEAPRIPEDVLSKILLSIMIQRLIWSFASAPILPVGFFMLLQSLQNQFFFKSSSECKISSPDSC